MKQVYAVGGEGTQGTFGGMKIWKSSITASNEHVTISTIGFVRVGCPIVGTPGTASSVVITNGIGSTITVRFDTTSKTGNGNYIVATSSNGWGYNTFGTTPAQIQIPWDTTNVTPAQ